MADRLNHPRYARLPLIDLSRSPIPWRYTSPNSEAPMKIQAMKWTVWIFVSLSAVPAFGASCDSLKALTLKDTTITMAQVVPAGQFSPPGERQAGTRAANPYKELADFCRVAATIKPTSDSDIKVEVWLP